ncbi:MULTISPECIES: hypothetical protein [Bradyrhizobium]|uniref:Uncharacterized protein n=1 Tax=Bradyrhizobium zhengyangense TaxID=2911009 RepID=A0A9X1RDJ8_9BRAD|nr:MULTISPECIES: hypothetical protein [Bradyrhizobium]MCG2629418.1 hypothetical protein [Bradyrhizobium zhengyangense]MCG2644955.1 hypothetical protein [Bradyrhizobium zhengyangense]MCG2670932.1 hypothetical protein [Bradyrhizobium zhengyangense]MDN4984564.1 hypothetical protein [Bradyrhizobium sp. WYCCWR 13022]MDN5002556.1 hypothetical protein [Bradyrhizobium sp. WYCCWR 12677]
MPRERRKHVARHGKLPPHSDIDIPVRVDQPARARVVVTYRYQVLLLSKLLKSQIEQDAQPVRPRALAMQVFASRKSPACDDVPIRDQIETSVSAPNKTHGNVQALFIEELFERHDSQRVTINSGHRNLGELACVTDSS